MLNQKAFMARSNFPDSLLKAIADRQIADWVPFLSQEGRNQIAQVLKKGMLEGYPHGNIVESVRKILDQETLPNVPHSHATIPTNRRAAFVVHQELGFLYAMARDIRHKDVCRSVPELKKVWVQSGGTKEPNDGHVLMHGLMADYDKPFRNPITGRFIMYPRDPSADIGETIDCSCDVVLYRPLYGPLDEFIGSARGRNLNSKSALQYDPVPPHPTAEEVADYMEKIAAILRKEPGLIQSELYKRFKPDEKDKAGYAISKLKYSGAIRREKRGKSFALWLDISLDAK